MGEEDFAPSGGELKGILDVLDSDKDRILFMQLLGFEPEYDENGFLRKWKPKKYIDDEEAWRDQYTALLALMASKRAQGLWINDPEDEEDILLEIKNEVVLELLHLQRPQDVEPNLAAEELAKAEMRKAMTLAKDGILVKALLGSPTHVEEPPKPIETESEEKKPRGLLGLLLGRR